MHVDYEDWYKDLQIEAADRITLDDINWMKYFDTGYDPDQAISQELEKLNGRP